MDGALYVDVCNWNNVTKIATEIHEYQNEDLIAAEFFQIKKNEIIDKFLNVCQIPANFDEVF